MPPDGGVTSICFLGRCRLIADKSPLFPGSGINQVKGGYDLSEKHQLSLNLFASGDSFALKLDGEDVDEDVRGNISFGSGFRGNWHSPAFTSH